MDVEKNVREYIDKTVHMSLGTSKDGKPWVCEVHFAYDDDLNLYFRSLASRRHSQEITNNQNVAGNIVKQHELGEPAIGVYFEGIAKQLEPGDEQDKAFECVTKRLQASEDILDEAKRADGHQFYKITVDKFYLFGKFGNEGGKKHELNWSENQK